MIIDGHAHLNLDQFGNEKELSRQMRKAKVDKAVLVPGGLIDVRKMSKYEKGELAPNPLKPVINNIEQIIKEYPDVYYGFISVDPNWGKEAVEYVEKGIRLRGFKGLKMAPIVYRFSFEDKTVKQLACLCRDYNIPFYTHVLNKKGVCTYNLEKLVNEFPKTNFILGHLGQGPNDVKAVEMANQYSNFYLETSLGNFLVIKKIINNAGPSKLIFGSEFPLSHPAIELKKIKLQKISDSEKEMILAKNLLNLINH